LYNHSVIKSSSEDIFFGVIPLKELTDVNQTRAVITRARHELYAGGPICAQGLISLLLNREEEIPEALLVQAELFIHQDSRERASMILEGLDKNPGVPEWIRVEAREFIERMNP
jgi:hypothetical protein